MSLVLAIDTSTWWSGVAVVRAVGGGASEVLAEHGARILDSHAVHVLGHVEAVLERAAVDRRSIEAFVAVRGPGSFTGIRIALGTVRGLAMASGAAVIGVDTLRAMAAAADADDGDRLVMLGAGRGEVYHARYDADGMPPRMIAEPRLGTIAEALEASGGTGRVVPGPDVRDAVQAVLQASNFADRFRLTAPPTEHVAAAAARVAIADRLPEAGLSREVAPLYIRPSDAEIKPRGPIGPA